MDWLKEAILKSVLGQLTITVVLLTIIGYMYVTTGSCPDDLIKIFWAVLAFYFGSKVENTKMRKL